MKLPGYPGLDLYRWLFSVVVLSGCASGPVDQIELMPAPDVYGDGLLNPLPETNPFDRIPYDGILFATDRAPATEDNHGP